MKFHISGKIGVPIGIVLLLLGVGIIVSAFGNFEDAEDIEAFKSEPGTEFVQEFIDEDKSGSAGWYLMIQGEYFVDNNDDNIIDACDGLNITITDSQGNDMNSTSGKIYCEFNDNRKMAGLDEENVDMNDGWMIVGIICDTYDDAEMNGYWETTNAEDGSESEKWVETDESDRCEIGEKYTISSNQDMILFDRHTQEELEEEGFWELICGLCCACLALILVVVSAISGFAMNPGTSAFTTMELGGASPVPVSGEGATIPGTTSEVIFGSGPPAQPVAVPLTEEGGESSIESSADALKKKFLSGAADKVTDSDEPEKE
tara:strand:+ start:887 stop:1837 length:951 start_codon:yes stop_codon:yes gene_type:complete